MDKDSWKQAEQRQAKEEYYFGDHLLKTGQITKEEYESILLDKKAHAELLEEYFNKVKNGEMTIDEIENEEDRAEIQRRIDAESQNDYGISDETYNNIIDDYTASLTAEVASNGYY